MDGKTSEWRPGPTVCRCCLTEGCYKDISTEYFWMGKREVYAEMLSETLNVSIAYSQSGGPNSNSRLICEPCISRLRDAAEFKRQVQECEKTFMQHLDPGTAATSTITLEVEAVPEQKDKSVKLEQVKTEKQYSDDDFGGNDFAAADDDDDDDLDDQPLTKFASKVPKKESVDLLDLFDNSQITLKRKSKTKTPTTKKTKVAKKDPVKATAASSKAVAKPVAKKKKGTMTEMKRRQGVLTSLWEMTLSERHNASIFIGYTSVTPFVYCRYYFKCFFCREHYTDIKALLVHTKTHKVPEQATVLKELLPKGRRTVKVDISELKCRLCELSFIGLDEIRKHLVELHGREFTESGNGLVAYNLKTKDGQFSCHICEKVLQTFILLNRHMNVHFSNAVCETCGAGFMTHQRLLQHKEIHQPGGYPCTRCDKVYTTNSNLKYHIEKTHEKMSTRTRMLRCPHCSERFTEHFRKLKHLKEVHGITFSYECEVCKSVFPSRRSLTMHTNKYHTVKTQCQVCMKSFGSVTTLKKHMVCHSEEKNHVCGLCPKTYRHKKSLTQHLRTHIHAEDCVKFTCPDCGSGFPTKDEYDGHLKEWHLKTCCGYIVN